MLNDPLFDGSSSSRQAFSAGGGRRRGGGGGGVAGSVSLGGSIRTGFNHINDIFSQFTKYISPTYHHERPERSVQMRLYMMQKGQYLLTAIMFLCLFFIALLMGMAGPRIVTEHKEYARLLPRHRATIGDTPAVAGPTTAAATAADNDSSLASGPYNIMTPWLNVYRQQLWLSAQISLRESNKGTLVTPFKVSLIAHGLTSADPSSPSNEEVLSNVSRTRSVRCASDQCQPLILLHVGSLHYPRYAFGLTFSGLEALDRHFGVADVVFTMTTYNPEFTVMEVWFRFFFFLATAFVLTCFIICMRNYSLDDWAIEQKWSVLLLLLLVGFDNPLYPLCILSSWTFPAVLDVFLQSSFVFSLLLYWLCIFHGLRQTERGTFSFYLIKVMMVGMMWLSATSVAYFEKQYELKDPSFSYQLQSAHHHSFQLMFMTMLGFYVTYLLYLALRAFGELRSMNFIEARLKFHTATLVIVFSLLLSIMSNRYGKGVLEDNLIAQVYTSYQSEYHFLAFYTVLNCYVYVLAYMYAPTSAQAKATGHHLLRDNPAFSMVNESDHEDDLPNSKSGGGVINVDDDEDEFSDEDLHTETDALVPIGSSGADSADKDAAIKRNGGNKKKELHWLENDDSD